MGEIGPVIQITEKNAAILALVAAELRAKLDYVQVHDADIPVAARARLIPIARPLYTQQLAGRGSVSRNSTKINGTASLRPASSTRSFL